MKTTDRRHAYTLVELVISMSLATLLITGLSSSLFIATAAFDISRSASLQRSKSAEVIGEMLGDLNLAISFSERTPTSIEFKVPDRNSDQILETIRYEWSGVAGDPLTMQYNSSDETVIAEDVHQLDFTYLTREMIGEGGP